MNDSSNSISQGVVDMLFSDINRSCSVAQLISDVTEGFCIVVVTLLLRDNSVKVSGTSGGDTVCDSGGCTREDVVLC